MVGAGALINYRRSQWTFGEAPLGIEEERVLEAVVDALLGA